jgi:hypothetical protein
VTICHCRLTADDEDVVISKINELFSLLELIVLRAAAFILFTIVASGTTDGPSCDEQSFTGESNNVTLVGFPPVVLLSPPRHWFAGARVFGDHPPKPEDSAARPSAKLKERGVIEDTFDVNFVANISHYTLDIRFDRDQIEVTANEASGLIRNGRLMGKRRS